MVNFDLLLNIPLKMLGLAPIFPRKSNYLNYLSFIYTGVVLLFIICGELDYICKVYIRNVQSDILKVDGLTKYIYLVRDLTGVLFAAINLIGTHVFHVVRNSAELKLRKVDTYLNLNVKRLRKSVVFFVVYFLGWNLISLKNVSMMKPRSFSRLLSLSVGTMNAFTITDFVDKLYLRLSEINSQLESLLDYCKETNQIKGKSSGSRDIERIRVLGKCHVEVCRIIDKTGENYSLSMIIVLLVIFINTISFSTYFLVGGINDRNSDVFVRYASWSFIHVALAYYLLYKGTQLSEEANGIRNIIWNNMRLPLDTAVLSEVCKKKMSA